MIKKTSFVLLLMSASICLCLMSSTYSRYIADTTGNIDILFAKWQILVNNADITNSATSSVTFEPVIETNENVAGNMMAPTSKGYFDIDIDPTNVDVSFAYSINLNIENANIPDLIITKYAIVPTGYIEGDHLDIITLAENTITNTLTYNKEIENFSFEPFTVRIYFEWIDGEGSVMSDEEDSQVGLLAATSDTTFKINADIHFEQQI